MNDWLHLALVFPRGDGFIGRGRGILLPGLFGAYIFVVLRARA